MSQDGILYRCKYPDGNVFAGCYISRGCRNMVLEYLDEYPGRTFECCQLGVPVCYPHICIESFKCPL